MESAAFFKPKGTLHLHGKDLIRGHSVDRLPNLKKLQVRAPFQYKLHKSHYPMPCLGASTNPAVLREPCIAIDLGM